MNVRTDGCGINAGVAVDDPADGPVSRRSQVENFREMATIYPVRVVRRASKPRAI
jgi:hypothetical protein